MKSVTTFLLVILWIPAYYSQKLDVVEGSIETLDTASEVSIEFYYTRMMVNHYPNPDNFIRAYADNEEVVSAYLSARDSLNQRAFMAGYRSLKDTVKPVLINNTTSTRFHLLINSVHWSSNFDQSEPDEITLEFILLDNPQRRLQQSRYYMKKVKGSLAKDVGSNMASAYFAAGKLLAKSLQNHDAEGLTTE